MNTICQKSSSTRSNIFIRHGVGGGSGPGNSNTLTPSKGSSKREKHKGGSMRSSSRKAMSAQLSSSGALSPGASNSQWYTTATSPVTSPMTTPVVPNFNASWAGIESLADGSPPTIFELRQELTPKRPLRSEVERERRLSRPSSGQFQASKINLSFNNEDASPILGTTSPIRYNGNSSNRDSIATTDSTASEEDGGIPPPLPVKTREADYCNLPDDPTPQIPRAMGVPASLRVRNKPPPPEPVDEDGPPPTPPPKRPPLRPPTERFD